MAPDANSPQVSVLYVCNLNAVRSPMAEALTKSICGKSVYVDSAGLEPSERDGFAISVLKEIGIDMTEDLPLDLEEIDIGSFDVVICLTEEAYERVKERVKGQAVSVEFWPTRDPFANAGGSREQRLAAYRELRDDLRDKIERRFKSREKSAV